MAFDYDAIPISSIAGLANLYSPLPDKPAIVNIGSKLKRTVAQETIVKDFVALHLKWHLIRPPARCRTGRHLSNQVHRHSGVSGQRACAGLSLGFVRIDEQSILRHLGPTQAVLHSIAATHHAAGRSRRAAFVCLTTVSRLPQHAIAQRFSGVLGMFSNLEVKVLSNRIQPRPPSRGQERPLGCSRDRRRGAANSGAEPVLAGGDW